MVVLGLDFLRVAKIDLRACVRSFQVVPVQVGVSVVPWYNIIYWAKKKKNTSNSYIHLGCAPVRARILMTLLTYERMRTLLFGLGWYLTARLAASYEPAALQLLIASTLLYLIATNLGQRRQGEASAYSVFNNGVQLAGQLRAEQFDNEVRHRPVVGPEEDSEREVPFRSPDRPGQVLLAPDRHALILAELRREALAMKNSPGARKGASGRRKW